jgi:hypothetical protein
VAAGQQQDQYNAVITMPIPLCEPTVSVYSHYTEAEIVEGPCFGNADKPEVEKGFLCVYREPFGSFGSRESQDKNASFFGFQDADGFNFKSGGPPEFNQNGTIAVFRTDEFKEESPKPVLAKEAYLVASGGWGVTAK